LRSRADGDENLGHSLGIENLQIAI